MQIALTSSPLTAQLPPRSGLVQRRYNDEHYHSGIGLLTPASLHDGQAGEIIAGRKTTLQDAWRNNPERFVRGIPQPEKIPAAVWINAPKREREMKNEAPKANCPGAPEVTSMTHPRSGYPSVGCVSAEPTSVSPDIANIQSNESMNTRAMPRKISGFQGLAPDQCCTGN